MQKKRLVLRFKGMFIEMCMARVTHAQKKQIVSHCGTQGRHIQSRWYDNKALLAKFFNADNWWSIDDMDHAMGLVFSNRSAVETQLSAIVVEIDCEPVSFDPKCFKLQYFAPEALYPLDEDQCVLCHGFRRQAELQLLVDIAPPFDPSLISLSFLKYPGYGNILIDLDYDGHDDFDFNWGETTYLNPRFLNKDPFDDTSRQVER